MHVRKEPSLVTHTAAAFLRPLFPTRNVAKATTVIVADMLSKQPISEAPRRSMRKVQRPIEKPERAAAGPN